MSIWEVFTTIVLLFVTFGFLNITYNYIKRYMRINGIRILPKKLRLNL